MSFRWNACRPPRQVIAAGLRSLTWRATSLCSTRLPKQQRAEHQPSALRQLQHGPPDASLLRSMTKTTITQQPRSPARHLCDVVAPKLPLQRQPKTALIVRPSGLIVLSGEALSPVRLESCVD